MAKSLVLIFESPVLCYVCGEFLGYHKISHVVQLIHIVAKKLMSEEVIHVLMSVAKNIYLFSQQLLQIYEQHF